MAALKGSTAAVSGCAGFIGPHLVRGLARKGAVVRGADINAEALLRLGPTVPRPADVFLFAADVRKEEGLRRLLDGADTVFHMAADPDVRNSTAHPLEHFEQNVMGTLTLLEGMRRHDVKRLVFPSTSTVYGDADVVPTPESYSPLVPISVYGASKLACESLLSSYAATYGFDAIALRFANVVGPGATHGVIVDLVEKLKRDPERLEVLGDGKQKKSYVHIDDLVRGTLAAASRAPRGFQVYNVGSKDTLLVDRIAKAVIEAMGLKRVKIVHKPAPGGRGWVGDVKVMQLDIKRLKALGWKPRLSSREAVLHTAKAVAAERAAVKV